MTTCYPALRGKFGRTEYFLITMPVSELVGRVRLPADMPGWESLSVEERYQRKLDTGRIRREIAPYFARDPNRFSGSLVLAVANDENMKFEGLSRIVDSSNLPGMYVDASSAMGFVVMHGSEVLVPLDGQHRAKAFQMAMEGYSDKRHSSVKSNLDLGRDSVAVLLVRFEPKANRHIFNKINRYAKPTAKADKLITDDDDSIAVITRSLIRQGTVPTRLVNIATNALDAKAHEFTTLATLYEANKKLVTALPIPTTSKPTQMGDLERDARLQDLEEEWNRLLAGIGPWREAVRDPSENGDAARTELRRRSVLGRPIGQLALVTGYALACRKNRESADRGALVARLDAMDWGMDAPEWRGLLVKPNGRIMAGTSASNNAGIVIAHRIGAELTARERDGALRFIHGNASERKKLPPRV